MQLRSVVELTFELSPVPMLMASEDGTIVIVNAEMASLFGYKTDELEGKPISLLVPPSVRGHHGRLIEAFMRVPARRAMGRGRTLVGIAKSGEEIPLELGLNAITVEDTLYSVVVAIDLRQQIAEQRRIEHAMEATPTAMIIVDSHGTMDMANRAAEKLTGYGRAELLGRKVEMLMASDLWLAHQVYRENFATMSVSKNMASGRMISVRNKAGEDVPVEIALTAVETASGDQIMCTIVDLRDRIAAERAIQDRNAKLTQANNELIQFGYAVSHDLKAPLASLQGLLGIIREHLQAGKTDQLARNLDRAFDLCARHAARVEKLLSLTGRDAEPEISMVRILDLVAAVWDGIAPGIGVAKKLRTDFKVEAIPSNELFLEVILQNLLSNAAKYHDPEKKLAEITVRTRRTKDGFTISVCDNGVGIAEKHQKEVFEMFKRIDRRCGDGIGLALVQRQVERLGGRIELKSTPGQGSTFSAHLPEKECG